jgi:hypothetical protein
MINGSQYPPFGFSTSVFMYPPTSIELISGVFVVMCTQIVIIGLINTICGVSITKVFIVGSLKLLFKFLPVNNPPNQQLKFIADPIIIHFSATFMLGTTTVSTVVVVMIALND